MRLNPKIALAIYEWEVARALGWGVSLSFASTGGYATVTLVIHVKEPAITTSKVRS